MGDDDELLERSKELAEKTADFNQDIEKGSERIKRDKEHVDGLLRIKEELKSVQKSLDKAISSFGDFDKD